MDQGTERAVVHFVTDAVAGARRTPGRLETGGIPPKPPATTLLSLLPSLSWSSIHSSGGIAALPCSYALSWQPYFSIDVAPATEASCRGTSQQNIAFQMFLQLQTLRRHVSRPVAAGVYPSLKDVAASQFVCRRGADNLSSFVSSFGSDLSSTCFGWCCGRCRLQ